MEKGRWEPVKTTQKPELTVGKLAEGHKYKFRVIAESSNGDSEPLELSEPITAKNPFSKCCQLVVVFLCQIAFIFFLTFFYSHILKTDFINRICRDTLISINY